MRNLTSRIASKPGKPVTRQVYVGKKNAVAKIWSLTASFDGVKYSDYPAGDKPNTNVAPTVTAAPQVLTAVVGSPVLYLNGTATGTPTPTITLTEILKNGVSQGSSYTPVASGESIVIRQTFTNAAGSVQSSSSAVLSSNAPTAAPILTSLSSYGADVGSSSFTLTATGSFQSGDQIVLWNTPLATTFVNATTLTATVPGTTFNTPNYGTVVIRRSSTLQSYPLPFESTPTNTATSNFVLGLTSALQPTYGAGGAGTHPAKGTVVTQATTGLPVRRITSVTDTAPAADGVQNFRNIYSKWSSINATGEYAIAEIQNSTTTYLYRLSDGACLGKVSGTTSFLNSVGENSEPRWSTRGDEPYTIYYMAGSGSFLGGKKLCKKDIVNNTPEVVVKDFTAALGLGAVEYLYCDSEGTPSIDMRKWAWMRRDDGFGGVREFVVYDVLTDTMVRCKAAPTSGFVSINATGLIINTNQFNYRPNWVSMSPRGDRVQLGCGQSYNGSGNGAGYGTDLDMVRTFKAEDFSDSRVCCTDETHGAWCWGPNMEQCWVAQNNRKDVMEVCLDISATLYTDYRAPGDTQADPRWTDANGANRRRTLIALSGTWNNNYANEPGQHYMYQMSGRKRGFAFVGTDGTFNANAWGYNNILCFRISDGRLWRAGTIPHQYKGSLGANDPDGSIAYFSEVQWCIDPFGINFFGSSNWQNVSGLPINRNECYSAQLPHSWQTNAIWN